MSVSSSPAPHVPNGTPRPPHAPSPRPSALRVTTPLSSTIRAWLARGQQTQSSLAYQAGISPACLSYVLTNRRPPGLRTVRKLEKAMGLHFGTLMRLCEEDP